VSDPVDERTYRWPRRYAFALTVAAVIVGLFVLVLLV